MHMPMKSLPRCCGWCADNGRGPCYPTSRPTQCCQPSLGSSHRSHRSDGYHGHVGAIGNGAWDAYAQYAGVILQHKSLIAVGVMREADCTLEAALTQSALVHGVANDMQHPTLQRDDHVLTSTGVSGVSVTAAGRRHRRFLSRVEGQWAVQGQWAVHGLSAERA